ncbi:MAG: hypothetical protein D6732_00615, partial [Methanobacteriota archaeon]
MKTNSFFKPIICWMIVLLFVIHGGMLYSQPRPSDVQYMGAHGALVNGIRCGTVAPDEARREQLRQQIERWLQSGNFFAPTTTITIPVAFHIVRHDDGFGDVTDQQISDQLDVLNVSYASTNFQFSLHSIERVNNTSWSTHYPGDPEETEMKQALAVDPAHVLNFYTCDLDSGLLGYATFPLDYPEDSFMHGVVVLYASLPGGSAYPYNEGDTGTHEVGHFVGLYHTFQGGCTPPGDEVDDTPFQDDGNNVFDCDPNLDTCPQQGSDPVDNFMNYTDDDCMDHFTPGQGTRMDEQMSLYRPSMYNQNQIQVVVDQKLSDGQTRIGTIGRWDGVDFLPRFSPPDTFIFAVNSSEVFHGDTIIYSNEKYHDWNNDPDVTNHHVFTITSDLSELTSNFNPTKPNVTIRNEFLSAPPGTDPSNDVIDFKDPWLIDSTDAAHGNNPLNRGMQAIFRTQSSPFNPDYTNHHNGYVYRGVFLDQPFTGNNPHYLVRAAQQQVIPFHGQDITWYFQGWEGDQVQFQYPNQTKTAVVFKANNAEARAVYKGHLASDTTLVTSFNNGRRLVQTNDGTWHLVYSDADNIYYTTSTDNGQTWSKEEKVNLTTGKNTSPSITTNGVTVAVVWDHDYTSGHQPILRVKISPGLWGPEVPPPASYVNDDNTTPAILYGYHGGVPTYYIISWVTSLTSQKGLWLFKYAEALSAGVTLTPVKWVNNSGKTA